ncbi:protein AIM2 [Podospora australis]|uniref:Protein AIM2 n=1 Tax=Podospora australis TaxID=1536484 RepID=A0AAN7AF82_9PEZI|nr:protein AIM2 [Podospora australis]
MRASVLSSVLLLLHGVAATGGRGGHSAGGGGKDCSVVDASIVAHTGTPVGREVVYKNITIYISTPDEKDARAKARSKTAVLYLTDVFGIPLNQNKLLVDSFARAGYLTIAPDLFKGEPAPADINAPGGAFNVTDFLLKNGEASVDPIIDATVEYINTKLKVAKIAVTGYCFGGKYAFRHVGAGKKGDVAFTAHPSMLTDAEISGVKKPAAVAAAETDNTLTPAQRLNLEAKLSESKQPFRVSLYSGTAHGFAVRANISDPIQKFGKEEAFLQAVRWFDHWLI